MIIIISNIKEYYYCTIYLEKCLQKVVLLFKSINRHHDYICLFISKLTG